MAFMALTRVTCKLWDICGFKLAFRKFPNIMWIGFRTYKNVIGLVLTLESTMDSQKINGTKSDKWNPMDIYLQEKSTVDGSLCGDINGVSGQSQTTLHSMSSSCRTITASLCTWLTEELILVSLQAPVGKVVKQIMLQM